MRSYMKCKEQKGKKSWRCEAAIFDIGDFELARRWASALGILDGLSFAICGLVDFFLFFSSLRFMA